ncbi:hypothetical protein PPN31119_03407 [Pandoraea pnomenusa]|uniref:Uncharacterized protein n=1 Tax=Pandoraea pnomenusa TaxID=93220 RepID=A0ABY6WMK2_9BURK|nr:hypothetical protein [Pandoraea pnomenusa]VVE69790.1 hypothetical protein PPN31119_03407 [Pandoraea pnomenusa]
MDSHNTKDFEALGIIVDALKSLEPEGQRRVLLTVATFLNLHITSAPEDSPSRLSSWSNSPRASTPEIASFSEERSITSKEFLKDKQPRTDVERVTCLAYYLTHYRDTPYFKTIDISGLNTEAAQPKFSSASVAVDNAAKSGYLVAAQKGSKQLSSLGEVFVQQLPDRDAAKAAVSSMKPRRKLRRAPRRTQVTDKTSTTPDNSD